MVFLCNVVSKLFSAKYKTNAPVLQIECIAEYIFYALIYYYLFKNKILKNLILTSVVIISVFFIVNAIAWQPFNSKFPTYVYIPTQILYVLFSLLMFKQMLLYPLKINIIKQGVFWYNTAMLFYATTMFLNLGLTNIYAQHNHWDNYIFYFWYGIVSVFHTLIGVSIFTASKEINTNYA